MLFFYNIFITFIYFLALIFKSASARKGSAKWLGRLGVVYVNEPIDIWMHASSVGETRILGHLITYLTNENRDLKIHVTTMTDAGQATAKEFFKTGKIGLSYFPLDYKVAIKKTFDSINPKMLLIAETEIWPNLINEAKRNNIPVVLINGRMSPKAFGKYKLIRNSLTKILKCYDHFFLKTDEDFQRFGYFNHGVLTEVAGDMKFDAPIQNRSIEKVTEIKNNSGVNHNAPLFVAGSTRPGEEELLLDCFANVSRKYTDFTMIIAPRHLDRLENIALLINSRGLDFKFYSESEKNNERLILIDQLGLLNQLYLAADISFVGGTLVDIGGHNLLEPVWAGSPVLFGPSVFNVTDASEFIKNNNYGMMINDSNQLTDNLIKFFNKELTFEKKSKDSARKPTTEIIGQYILKRISND
jgi:tRNA (guanine-N7-)-methyltransferase